MILMGKNSGTIVNLSQVENIFIGGDRCSIKANMASRSGCELAKYDNAEQCRYAMEMLYEAIKGDERAFQFPKESEMEHARQQRSQFRTKANRHGGS